MLNKLLCVDPGWGTTAFAYFRNEITLPIVSEYSFLDGERFKKYVDTFQTAIIYYSPKTVIIEGVENWQGSLKSRTAAARQDTIKLAYLVGAYYAICSRNKVNALILTAREWKGQLSKEATAKRVERIFKQKIFHSEHVIDAIAIGLSRDIKLWQLEKSVSFQKNKLEM